MVFFICSLFYVIPHKEKNNILDYCHTFYCLSFCCAMTVLSTNIRAFHLYAESSKFHNLYFEACTCIRLVLTKMAEMLHKTVFISLLDMHTFYQHSIFKLLMSKEGLKEKERRLLYLSKSFSALVVG